MDKPAIQYIVEEAAASGIEDILIITNRGKGLLEDHFDRAPELERRLAADPAKAAILDQVVRISKLANIFYVRQKETKGLGHAIGCAREFVGDEPFACALRRRRHPGRGPRLRPADPRLRAVRQRRGGREGGGSGRPFPEVLLPQGGASSRTTTSAAPTWWKSPSPGRSSPCTPFWAAASCPRDLRHPGQHPSRGGRGNPAHRRHAPHLARRDGMTAVDFTGTRYDMGNKLGIMQARRGSGPEPPGDRGRFPSLFKRTL